MAVSSSVSFKIMTFHFMNSVGILENIPFKYIKNSLLQKKIVYKNDNFKNIFA